MATHDSIRDLVNQQDIPCKEITINEYCGQLPPEHKINKDLEYIKIILNCLYFEILEGIDETFSEKWWEAEKIREILTLLGEKDTPKRQDTKTMINLLFKEGKN